MLFTVDEARALKPTLVQMEDLDEEYKSYKSIVSLFSIWLFILTTLRSVVVSTIIVSMLNQEPNLAVAWEKGDGVGFFLVYLFISCLPVIGNLVVFVAPIAVIIAAFTTGKGIAGNFSPFVLPMAIAYAVTYGLVFYSNVLINSIVKARCPKIYEEIEFLLEADDFTRMLHLTNARTRKAAFDVEGETNTKAEEKKNSVRKSKRQEEDEDEDNDEKDI